MYTIERVKVSSFSVCPDTVCIEGSGDFYKFNFEGGEESGGESGGDDGIPDISSRDDKIPYLCMYDNDKPIFTNIDELPEFEKDKIENSRWMIYCHFKDYVLFAGYNTKDYSSIYLVTDGANTILGMIYDDNASIQIGDCHTSIFAIENINDNTIEFTIENRGDVDNTVYITIYRS